LFIKCSYSTYSRKVFVHSDVKTESHILPHYRFQEGFSVRPSSSSEKYDISTCGPVCVYSGFGRTFERINPGEEIAITVFGRRGVGKTSLLCYGTPRALNRSELLKQVCSKFPVPSLLRNFVGAGWSEECLVRIEQHCYRLCTRNKFYLFRFKMLPLAFRLA
uniref:Kinesin motor domain-containing protein n=1 Tax=Angiostrongylus costaricensis TaxID=334426 RepID=A0A0R3PH01_ANGCS